MKELFQYGLLYMMWSQKNVCVHFLNVDVIDLTGDDKDDLQRAIALSLEESNRAFRETGITDEEQAISRWAQQHYWLIYAKKFWTQHLTKLLKKPSLGWISTVTTYIVSIFAQGVMKINLALIYVVQCWIIDL